MACKCQVRFKAHKFTKNNNLSLFISGKIIYVYQQYKSEKFFLSSNKKIKVVSLKYLFWV